MAEDPYKVLGVPREASDDDVRRAYRKLAKELHPDLNPANRVSAEERFKKVSAAYEIVGDATKRGQYDRGEIDANGEQRRTYQRAHTGGPFGGRAGGGRPGEEFGFSDIFSDLFGANRRSEGASPFGMRGRDVRYTLEVDFLEAATGAKKRVTMPDSGVLDITVPEGVADGQTLRLKGQGAPGPAAARRAMRWSRSGAAARPVQARRRRTSSWSCRLASTRRCSAPRSRCRRFPGACS
jgi:DnaJ-class molecular chaperone